VRVVTPRIEITLEPDGPPVVHGRGEPDELKAWLRRDERARQLVVAATALGQEREALRRRLWRHAGR
jgi:hypothetical protein